MSDLAVKLRSWHLIDFDLGEEGPIYHTLCGRTVQSVRFLDAAAVPGDEKTCERCYFLSRKRAG